MGKRLLADDDTEARQYGFHDFGDEFAIHGGSYCPKARINVIILLQRTAHTKNRQTLCTDVRRFDILTVTCGDLLDRSQNQCRSDRQIRQRRGQTAHSA